MQKQRAKWVLDDALLLIIVHSCKHVCASQVDKRLVSWTLSSSTRRPLFDIRKEGLTTSDSELSNTESLRTIATLPQPTCTVQAALPEKS